MSPFLSIVVEVRLPTGAPSLVIAVGAKLLDSCVNPEVSPGLPTVMAIGPPATVSPITPVVAS